MSRSEKPRGGSYFLAAQHQLRQPLNALSLLIGELRQTDDGRDREAIVDDMRYALDLSNAWLDSLTDLEKAEAGDLRLQVQEVSLQPIFARLRDEFLPHFTHLGLDFRVVCCRRATVRADPLMVRRLLSLLLDNAAKFTRDGKVLLGCRRVGGRLRIEVWDTGLGVAPEHHARLFEPFFRLENEVRPRERGLGLGLAYAQRLAALTGGELTVTSAHGRGSCFALSLPLVSAASAAAAANGRRPPRALQESGGPATAWAFGEAEDPSANPLSGAKVVLLEGAEARDLQTQLKDWGASVSLVPPAALSAALSERPALVIAERSAFVASGSGAALRQRDGRPAVILLSGEGTAEAGASLGVEAHVLGLPVKPARLRALCHFALSRG